MHRCKAFVGLFTAGMLALGAGAALASQHAAKGSAGAGPAAPPAEAPSGSHATSMGAVRNDEIRRVGGVVTAVEPGAAPPTLVVRAMEGTTPLIVGVDVPGTAIIRQGKAQKSLGDIKVGDRVWMKYARTTNHLLAEDIHILKPYRMAAKY